MLTTFFTAHADAFFWIGMIAETIGGFWFLFDSYRCDVAMARWTMLFPPLAIYLAIRYPEECLKSFSVCVAGAIFITLGAAYAPAGGSGVIQLPKALESVMNQ